MTRLKNETWTNQPIKNYKEEPWTQIYQTTDTTEKSRTHVFKFWTPPVERIVNLHGFALDCLFCTNSWYWAGCAMAEMFSHCSFTAEAQVQLQAILCGVCDKEVSKGTGFSLSTLVLSCHHSSSSYSFFFHWLLMLIF